MRPCLTSSPTRSAALPATTRPESAGAATRAIAGYTSYASLNDLPKRDPAFADLAQAACPPRRQVRRDRDFDLARKPRLDSLWVNLLKAGDSTVGISIRIRIISGTFYVEVPPARAPSASRTRACR